jgi:hypothetical protein
VGDDNNNKLSMPDTLGEDNNKQWGDYWTKGITQELNCERIYRSMKCNDKFFEYFLTILLCPFSSIFWLLSTILWALYELQLLHSTHASISKPSMQSKECLVWLMCPPRKRLWSCMYVCALVVGSYWEHKLRENTQHFLTTILRTRSRYSFWEKLHVKRWIINLLQGN